MAWLFSSKGVPLTAEDVADLYRAFRAGGSEYNLLKNFLYKKDTPLDSYVFRSVEAFIQKLTKRGNMPAKTLPERRTPTPKEVYEACLSFGGFQYYGVKESPTLKKASQEIEKEFTDNLLLNFLALVREKPSFLLGNPSKDGKSFHNYDGTKGSAKTGRVSLKELSYLPGLFDKMEHLAYFLWSMGTDSGEFTIGRDKEGALDITLKDCSFIKKGSSNAQQQAAKVSSILSELSKLDDRASFKFYEAIVNQKAASPTEADATAETLELHKKLSFKPEGCLELKVEAYYRSHYLPTINMVEMEEELQELTANVQKLREFYDKYRSRYPADAKTARIQAVHMICDEPMDYMLFPDKYLKVKELAKIVIEGYPPDKIKSRFDKF
jgi:hypothetical protein